MSQWIAGDVLTNGVKIHYTRTGGEKPPLVLLHGFSDNGLCWTRLAKDLESTYDIIMPDARGHGLSDGPGEHFSSSDRFADVAGLISELHLGKPALLGHSMGAMMTASVAADYPDLVSCVILEDPAWRDPSSEDEKASFKDRFGWIYRLKGLSRDELIEDGRKGNPTWVDEELGPWADSKIQLNLDLLKIETIGRGLSWRSVAERITCPALLITADTKLGAIVPPAEAKDAVTLMKNGRLVHIEGAGHNIRREQYEQFKDAVVSFLQEVYLTPASH